MISLIMTVYNREKYLKKAISSVIAQSFGDWELIIWDDGSSDKSVQIARDFTQKDIRIKLIESEHKGRVQSLINAHKLANGEYLGWIDSDDMLHPNCLKQTLEVLLNTYGGMVYTNCWVIDSKEKQKYLDPRSQIPFSQQRLLTDFITFHFRLIRHEIFNAVGGINPFFKVAMDYDLCLRISELTEIYHLPLPLYFYREHYESISREKQKFQSYYSQLAIKQALVRRKLDYELVVENNRFMLKPFPHCTKGINQLDLLS